jgi:uncharacterized protein (UPF0332 family)
MNPHDFLTVASTQAMGDTEAEWRSGASRAYYAAFHVARLLLQNSGFVVPRADQAHSYLWQRFGNCAHPDVEEAGRSLNSLRSMRNEADYDLDRPFLQSQAFNQVDLAVKVIQLLELVAATPTVQQRITDAIKVYERDVLRLVTWRP